MGDDATFDEDNILLDKIKAGQAIDFITNSPIGIAVSYDMAWQKRSSGHVYDSLSGHGFFIGCRTGKVISRGILKKNCAICTHYLSKNLLIPEHSCNINHDGSSGSMESILCKKMLEDIFKSSNKRCCVNDLVTDDDSTLRQYCSTKANGGELLPCIPQPNFLADPSHRCKTMVKKIVGMTSATRNPDEIKTIDALRLKKYTACYISQNWHGIFKNLYKMHAHPLNIVCQP